MLNKPALQLLHEVDQRIEEYQRRPDAKADVLASLRLLREKVAEPFAKINADEFNKALREIAGNE